MNKRKVLLFNAKRDKCDSESPHLGLAMLAAVLKKKGHEVLVVDYQFKHRCPSPEEFIKDFKPDVVGITLYTATMKEANRIINSVSKFDIPIIVGGPHATLYSDKLATDSRIAYIVKGEAEGIIAEITENIGNYQSTSKNRIIQSNLPDPQDLPYPDFTAFFSYKDILVYPLLTSRGCPYNCSFCAVHLVSSKKWRPRNPGDCIAEVMKAKRELPALNSVIVYDDSPMTRKEHAREFLELYIANNIDLPLSIINTRADCLDEEMVQLFKKVKCPSIGMGVEHGHPEVFNEIGKGETLDDIKKAAKLVKKYKMPLCLCFIIGLPGDSLEKTKHSINLAKELKPNHIFWNMATPFKGTRVREWYDQYGKVFDEIDHSSLVDGDFMCDEPCLESPDFSKEERKKAYLMAILETVDARLKMRHIPRLIPYVLKYGLYKEFFFWLPKHIKKSLVSIIFLPQQAVKIYRAGGIKGVIQRGYKFLIWRFI